MISGTSPISKQGGRNWTEEEVKHVVANRGPWGGTSGAEMATQKILNERRESDLFHSSIKLR